MNCNLVRGVLIFSGAMPLTPTLTPTPTYTPSITPTVTVTPTPTITQTPTFTFTPTYTPSVSVVSVSAYEWASGDVALSGIEMKPDPDHADYGVTIISLSSIETKFDPKDGAGMGTDFTGISMLSSDRDRTGQINTMTGVSMSPDDKDGVGTQQHITGIEMNGTDFDYLSAVMNFDGGSYSADELHKTSQVIDLSGSHIFEGRDQITANLSLVGVDHTQANETVASQVGLSAIDHREHRFTTKNFVNVHGIEHRQHQETSVNQVGFDGTHSIYNIIHAAVNVGVDEVEHVLHRTLVDNAINLHGVSMDTIDHEVSTSQVSLAGVDHVSDQIERSHSRTEMSGIEHKVGTNSEHVNNTQVDINLQQIEHNDGSGNLDRIATYGRVIGIRYTDDLSGFRITEFGDSRVALNRIEQNLSENDDQTHLNVRVDRIEHVVDGDRGGFITNAINVTELEHIFGVDNGRAAVRAGLSAVDQAQSESDTAKITIGSDHIVHELQQDRKVVSNIDLDHVHHIDDTEKTAITRTALSSIYLVDGIERAYTSVNFLSGDTTDGIERASTVMALSAIDHFRQLDTMVAIEELTGISHSSDRQKITAIESLSGIDFEFQEGKKASFHVQADNIELIFGESHNIGVAMGISDGNSTTYAAYPMLFDMSMIGASHSREDPSALSARHEMTGIQHIEQTFKIGANLVLDSVIYSLNNNGRIQTAIGMSNSSYSNNNNPKVISQIGLFQLAHIRDICFFDNTDTYLWDNELKRWDDDPPHP
jgi:hypothetical protein